MKQPSNYDSVIQLWSSLSKEIDAKEIRLELIPFKGVLSKREKEVLRLLIEGRQNKEIAEALKISKLTVDKHRKNMITRNNLKNSGELIAEAIKNGWLY